jgi:pilus assembly protein CpaB
MSRRVVLLVVAALVAVVGAAGIFLYVRNVESQVAAGQEPVEVLVATATVPMGQNAAQAQESGAFEVKTIAASAAAPGALSSIEPVKDEATLATIYPGEQVLEQKFGDAASAAPLPIPDGKIAVSVQLSDPARVAGFVGPGSEVAVFLTATPPTADAADPVAQQPLTAVLLPRVPVIAAGQTTTISRTTTNPTGAQTTEEIPLAILTLAVDQKQAEKLVQGQSQGEIYFGLLDDSSQIAAGSVTRFNDLLAP